MNDSYSSPISDDRDEYPKVTQADLDRATFRVGLQALIHGALPQSMRRDDLEGRLLWVIREELRGEVLRPDTPEGRVARSAFVEAPRRVVESSFQ